MSNFWSLSDEKFEILIKDISKAITDKIDQLNAFEIEKKSDSEVDIHKLKVMVSEMIKTALAERDRDAKDLTRAMRSVCYNLERLEARFSRLTETQQDVPNPSPIEPETVLEQKCDTFIPPVIEPDYAVKNPDPAVEKVVPEIISSPEIANLKKLISKKLKEIGPNDRKIAVSQPGSVFGQEYKMLSQLKSRLSNTNETLDIPFELSVGMLDLIKAFENVDLEVRIITPRDQTSSDVTDAVSESSEETIARRVFSPKSGKSESEIILADSSSSNNKKKKNKAKKGKNLENESKDRKKMDGQP